MKTALECWGNWGDYIHSFNRKKPALSSETIALRKHLLNKAKLAATLLREQYNIKRLTIVGSLAHQAWFHPDSDVDLAVEGLDTKAFWDAWKLVEDIIETHDVDLIDLDSIPEARKNEIMRYGIEL